MGDVPNLLGDKISQWKRIEPHEKQRVLFGYLKGGRFLSMQHRVNLPIVDYRTSTEVEVVLHLGFQPLSAIGSFGTGGGREGRGDLGVITTNSSKF